jgi:serine/threonine-protein kinase
VHRDIKPANIFVCRYGQDCDFVKVLDFGLVKAFGDEASTAPALTRDTVVTGTPPYMAPEQVMGGVLDGRADIYAVGCVAYWLLTGQTVFSADSLVGHLVHHVQTAPDPPSARTELPIPQALDALVLECLAKAPDDRPRSAAEVAERLSGVSVTAGWNEADARAWWDTHQPAGPDRAPRG